MKNNTTIAVIGIVSAVTIVGALTAPSVIHQIAVFAGGAFGVLVALAVCVARNIGEDRETLIAAGDAGTGTVSRTGTTDWATAFNIRAYRMDGWTDEAIAEHFGLDIDVVTTIK